MIFPSTMAPATAPSSSASAVWQQPGLFAPAPPGSSANGGQYVDAGGAIRDMQGRSAMTFNGGVHMGGGRAGGNAPMTPDLLAGYRTMNNPLLAALS
jgi:hypothetical protein